MSYSSDSTSTNINSPQRQQQHLREPSTVGFTSSPSIRRRSSINNNNNAGDITNSATTTTPLSSSSSSSLSSLFRKYFLRIHAYVRHRLLTMVILLSPYWFTAVLYIVRQQQQHYHQQHDQHDQPKEHHEHKQQIDEIVDENYYQFEYWDFVLLCSIYLTATLPFRIHLYRYLKSLRWNNNNNNGLIAQIFSRNSLDRIIMVCIVEPLILAIFWLVKFMMMNTTNNDGYDDFGNIGSSLETFHHYWLDRWLVPTSLLAHVTYSVSYVRLFRSNNLTYNYTTGEIIYYDDDDNEDDDVDDNVEDGDYGGYNTIHEDDRTCGVCFDYIRLSGKHFGLLQDCTHSFCADCIIRWYEHGHGDACPICRRPFEVVIPSTRWLRRLCDKTILGEIQRRGTRLERKYDNNQNNQNNGNGGGESGNSESGSSGGGVDSESSSNSGGSSGGSTSGGEDGGGGGGNRAFVLLANHHVALCQASLLIVLFLLLLSNFNHIFDVDHHDGGGTNSSNSSNSTMQIYHTIATISYCLALWHLSISRTIIGTTWRTMIRPRIPFRRYIGKMVLRIVRRHLHKILFTIAFAITMYQEVPLLLEVWHSIIGGGDNGVEDPSNGNGHHHHHHHQDDTTTAAANDDDQDSHQKSSMMINTPLEQLLTCLAQNILLTTGFLLPAYSLRLSLLLTKLNSNRRLLTFYHFSISLAITFVCIHLGLPIFARYCVNTIVLPPLRSVID